MNEQIKQALEALPPLPEPIGWEYSFHNKRHLAVHRVAGIRAQGVFTADQMRDYARAAIASLQSLLADGQAVQGVAPTLPQGAYWWSPKEGSDLSPNLACWSMNPGPHPSWDVTVYYSEAQVRELLAAPGVGVDHSQTPRTSDPEGR